MTKEQKQTLQLLFDNVHEAFSECKEIIVTSGDEVTINLFYDWQTESLKGMLHLRRWLGLPYDWRELR